MVSVSHLTSTRESLGESLRKQEALACSYLKIKPETLVGKSAVQVYPEIIASKNHRNMLRAHSGVKIPEDFVETRMGDIVKVSYTPVVIDKEVKAVILNAVIHSPKKN